MKLWLDACVLSLALVASTLTAAAQGPTYEEVEAKFAGTTYIQWEVDGYQKLPFCIDASLDGHPELGGMGFPAPNSSLMNDHVIDPLQPEWLWLDSEDQVIGVHCMVPSREEGQPELFGHPFVPTPACESVPRNHYRLNVWFVGALEDRFEYINPAVTCPPGTVYVGEAGLPHRGHQKDRLF